MKAIVSAVLFLLTFVLQMDLPLKSQYLPEGTKMSPRFTWEQAKVILDWLYGDSCNNNTVCNCTCTNSSLVSLHLTCSHTRVLP